MLNAKFNRNTCNTDTQNHNCNKISSAFIWLLNAIQKNLLVKRNQIHLWHKIYSLPSRSKLPELHSSQQIRAVHLSQLCPCSRGTGSWAPLLPSPKKAPAAPKIPAHSTAQPCHWLALPLVCCFLNEAVS